MFKASVFLHGMPRTWTRKLIWWGVIYPSLLPK